MDSEALGIYVFVMGASATLLTDEQSEIYIARLRNKRREPDLRDSSRDLLENLALGQEEFVRMRREGKFADEDED